MMPAVTRRTALLALAALSAAPILHGCKGLAPAVPESSGATPRSSESAPGSSEPAAPGSTGATPEPFEPVSARELTSGVAEDSSPSGTYDLTRLLADDASREATYGFAAGLLRESLAVSGGEVLTSPLSALYALALAANGASGETRSQMEGAFGMTTGALTDYLVAYSRRLAGKPLVNGLEDGDPLNLRSANSVWVRDAEGLQVSEDWLGTCKGRLGAQAFAAPFDSATVEDVNSWVSDKTDGMIPRLLDQISPDAALYLVNALAFDDAWDEPFERGATRDAEFTCEDGTVLSVPMMRSRESIYLENEVAEGFVKTYENGDFAFVGILPREGRSVGDVVAALDGASLASLALSGVAGTEADVGLPRFKASWEASLEEQLRALGITDAFDADRADFTPMGDAGDGRLFIGSAIQKTYVDVSEEGTRAAAATSFGMTGSSAPGSEEPEVKTVILNRPFLYLIVDWQFGTPLFAGVAQRVGE